MAPLRVLSLMGLATTAYGFFQMHSAQPRPTRAASIMMGGRTATPLGRTSTVAGKKLKVEEMKGKLDQSLIVFAIPNNGVSYSKVAELRKAMPESTSISVCKNSLIKRAVEGTEWESSMGEDSALSSLSNLWFFVGEDGLKQTLDGYEEWRKGPTADDYVIKGGCMEGTYKDSKEVGALLKLPSKTELLTKIAVGIKNAGAQGIAVRLKKAAGGKLAIAVKMALMDEEKNPNA